MPDQADQIRQAYIKAVRTGDSLTSDLAESGFFGEVMPPGMEDNATKAIGLISLGDQLRVLRRRGLDERWSQEQNALLNYGYLNGHHYIEIDRARRAVVAIPMPRNHVRRRVPMFVPWYRRQHGLLTRTSPTARVVAMNSSKTARDAAEFANDLLDWLRPRAFSFANRSSAAMWQLIGGLATHLIGVEWEDDEEYSQQTGMSYRPDLVFDVLSPMQFWCDNTHERIDGQEWCGQDLYMTEAEARAQYFDTTYDLASGPYEGEWQGYATLREIQNMLGWEDPWRSSRGLAGSPTPSEPNRYGNLLSASERKDVVLSEFWLKPGGVLQGEGLQYLGELGIVNVEVVRDPDNDPDFNGSAVVRFPEGLRCVFATAGNIIDIAPNHLGRLPYKEQKLQASAGYWAQAWATPLREVNQAINWAFSLREEHMMRTAAPVELIPEDARVHQRNSTTGATIQYRYRANRFGAKPELLNPPTLPHNNIEFLQELRVIWQDVAGVHDVSDGKLPSKLSGVAVSLLQEQDLNQLGYAGQEMEEAFKAVAEMALEYIQDFFPENDPRLAQIAGDYTHKIAAFMSTPVGAGLEIQVQEGTGLPRSAAAVRAEARELYELGALTDDLGRPDIKALKMAYNVGDRDALYREDDMDRQNAMNAEELILSLPIDACMDLLQVAMEFGTLPPPFKFQPWDNALIHEQSHRLRLKKQEAQPEGSPLHVAVLAARWQEALMAAAPLLSMIDPTAMAGAMSMMQEQGMGAEPTGEGDTGEAPDEGVA